MSWKWTWLTTILFIRILALFQRVPSEGFQVLAPNYELPKIVWTHWNSEQKPDFIDRNLKDRRKRLEPAGWKQVVLTDDTLHNYIPAADFPSNLSTVRKESQADWVRLKLLSIYGGVWMDAGIILNDVSDLEALHYRSNAMRSELTGFYIGSLTSREDYKVIENYFLMAPKGSELVTLWLKEFETAIQNGFDVHKKQLKAEGVDTQRIYEDDGDTYLTQHACMQAVLQKRLNRKPLVLITKAEDSILKYQAECEWKGDCINSKLNSIPREEQESMVKLRGIDRKAISLPQFF